MEFRQFVRGQVSWPRLEAVARELTARYGYETAHVRFLDADNWLSTPFVLDEEYFVKVISRQNSLVHAVFTAGRNIGAFSAGTEGFFEHFGTPYEMAEHELAATERMRAVGVNAPEPVEALEVDGLGVVVLEYLPEFRPLDELDADRERELAPDLFRGLATMHDNGLAHGDLRAENVLLLGDDLYFIDATSVRGDEAADGSPPPVAGPASESARRYDLACGLAALAPLIGARDAVAAARTAYPVEDLLGAREYLDFVNVRPDHDFDGPGLKGEIEHRVADDTAGDASGTV
ncbi:RIO1 family regulatory kinase/ATPase domain-containing protein [Candidatus Halobonum tyrrellensis]|uniref:non-specific serine/threonine protein kinase n=1 Tax=Candidatus Halobonum tyrrellensis G22 TaxID=1324957 RepID=V4IXI3_9EURY|nr:RIO1 family regulatory kinase/ATPase [Candidatus Halobonum tyrrellensis]ESP87867.1 aminoglycoside phosphotransferase [Candidatus Halobonum tyrrellensis G22]